MDCDLYWENIKYSKYTKDDMDSIFENIIYVIAPSVINPPFDMKMYFSNLSKLCRKNGIYMTIRFKDEYIPRARKSISECFILHNKQKYGYLILQPTEDKLLFSIASALDFRKFRKDRKTMEITFEEIEGRIHIHSTIFNEGKAFNLLEAPAMTKAIFNQKLEMIKLDEIRARVN